MFRRLFPVVIILLIGCSGGSSSIPSGSQQSTFAHPQALATSSLPVINIAALGDSNFTGKDDVPSPTMNPFAQTISSYNAQSNRLYKATGYNYSLNGADARTVMGTELPKMIATGLTFGKIYLLDGTNEVEEAWKYVQINKASALSVYTSRMAQMYSQVRTAYPNAEIIILNVRYFDIGCTQYTAPYYGYGINPYIGGGYSVDPYVQYFNKFIYASQSAMPNTAYVDLTLPVFNPQPYTVAYGAPADTGTSCIHTNNSGARLWDVDGMLAALNAGLVSGSPTPVPTSTAVPTATPTVAPTSTPTVAPTASASPVPTSTPVPTPTPTVAPTATATPTPSPVPTIAPTIAPTVAPTIVPTPVPTITPTVAPTIAPTMSPTTSPPTVAPTDAPTMAPTPVPSAASMIAPVATKAAARAPTPPKKN